MSKYKSFSINDLVLSLLSSSTVLGLQRFQKEAFLLYQYVFMDFMVDPLFYSTETGPYSINIENSLHDLEKTHTIEKRKELPDQLFVITNEAKNQIKDKLNTTGMDQQEITRYKTQWERWSLPELSRYIFLYYPAFSLEMDTKYIIGEETLDNTTIKNVGNILLDLSRFQDSIIFYDRALDKNPTEKDILNNKGLSLQGLQKFEEAITYFDKALEIDPEYVAALKSLNHQVIELKTKRGECQISQVKAKAKAKERRR